MVLTLSESTAILLSSAASSSVKFCLEGYILENSRYLSFLKFDYSTAEIISPLTRDFFRSRFPDCHTKLDLTKKQTKNYTTCFKNVSSTVLGALSIVWRPEVRSTTRSSSAIEVIPESTFSTPSSAIDGIPCF